MNTFLPTDYKVPKGPSNYMKFQQGANRFRILGALIMGYEYWTEDGMTKTPNRVRTIDEINTDQVDPKDIKHFWAMPVWNYQDKVVQILEITQKGIQRSLKALSDDEDWGNPTGFDIVVTKTGEKLETEYSVQPKPAKPLEKEIEDKFKTKYIKLDALYEGLDPFKTDEQLKEDKLKKK